MSKHSPISKLTHLKLGQGNSEPRNFGNKTPLQARPEVAISQEEITGLNQSKHEMKNMESVEKVDVEMNKADEWSFPTSNHSQFTKKFAEEETIPTTNKVRLPKFLEQNKIIQSVTNNIDSDVKMLPFSGNNENPNSFSSIFSKDHEEITGIRRVFRKSLIFLVLHILSLLLLAWTGLTLFTVNPIISLVSFVVFAAVTNLFYIIVADRSYVSLSLVGSAVGLLLIYSFLGQAFNPVSLAGVAIVSLLFYIAYSEIEKVQLSSRLFTISNIVGSGTRILMSAGILVLALTMFNQMLSEKSANFINRTILNNELIISKLIVGEGSPVSLNRLTMNGAAFYSTLETNATKTTFKDFLATNYRRGEDVVSKNEEPEIIISCENQKGSGKCGNAVVEARNERLEKFRSENYAGLPYNLDTSLNTDNFREISKQYYLNIINEFDSGSNIIIPRVYLLPGIFALLIYILLSLISPILSIIIQFLTWSGWQIMKVTGFAKIEVETVESEVVSI